MTTRSEFAAALTAIRQQADLSIRELARTVGIPPATIGGWFSGRNLPQPGHLTGLRHLLAVCGVPDADVPSWLDLVERVRATGTGAADRPSSPYPGLTSFGVDDAALFFGRRAETERVLHRLDMAGHRMTAVVGPSGSGKTSLLRAGVTAELRAAGRSVAVMTPGSEPSASLTEAMLGGPRVLVVDQFEELFTSVADPDARRTFLRDLVAGPASVVIGLRADFYSAAAAEPELLDVLRHGQLLLGPLTDAALRDAIVAPAAAVGVTVDAGLVDLVVADLTPRDALGRPHDSGALPLLSHALRAAWEGGDGGDGRVFGVEDYRRTGGIDGAIQRSAEQALAAVGPERYDDVRRLFLRLVTIDDTDATAASAVAVTRRRVGGAEFDALLAASDDTASGRDTTRVVDEFVERRLLTVGDGSLEISHEALVSAWPRLGDWIDEDRLGLVLHRQVTEAANAWLAADRDGTLLLRGSRLDAAAELAARPTPRTALNPVESEFVAAGVAARDRARHRARRTTSRLRRLLATVVVLLLAAGGLSVYALRAESDAGRAETDAAAARDLAVSRQIAGQAEQLQQSDPALAQQLALIAYRNAGSDLARSALVEQSSRPTITRVLGAQGPTPLAVARGRDALIAVGHADDGTVHLYRSRAGVPQVAGVVPAADPAVAQVFALGFSPDARLLAVSGESRVVRIWNVAEPGRPRPVATLRTTFTGDVQTLDWSPAGDVLAVGALGPRSLLAWDVTVPGTPRELSVPTLSTPATVVGSTRFSPDGAMLAASGLDGTVLTWRVVQRRITQPRKTFVDGSGVRSLAWTPDGSSLLAGSERGDVRPLDARTLRPTRAAVRVSSGIVNGLDVTPDGTRFAVASSDTAVSQWSTASWQQLSTQANPGPVTGVSYTDAGHSLLSTAADGTLRRYAAAPGIAADDTVFNLAVTSDGRRLGVATGGDAGGVRIWNVRNPGRPVVLSPLITTPAAAGAAAATLAFTADGRTLAIGTRTGYVVFFDVADPARPRRLGRALPIMRGGAQVESVAYSADDRRLVVGGDDNTVRLVDVADPARPRPTSTLQTDGLVFNVAFSPDGTLAAAASSDGHGYVWDVRDPRRPRRTAKLGGFASYAYAVAFAPDGRRLAVGSADHTTRLWRVSARGRTTAVGRSLIGPSGYVFGLAFSPDGTSLASASDDNAVRVYDVRGDSPSRVPQLTLDSSDSSMFAAVFTPDGRTLFGGGRGTSVSAWTTDVSRYGTALCRRIGTPITREEWVINVPGARYEPPCRT